MTETDIDLCRGSAQEQIEALARGELSARELLAETRERYERINPVINAVVTVDFDAAEAAAAESDRRRAAGEPVRPLEGLPIAVKDLEDTAGMRSTYGSQLHAEHVPARDSLVVERMRAAGAVIYGKTNTPEFGTGSHTYNRVFGTTTNPYAPDRSAGGSSGGAAAALAAGLSSVADGSDMGGSLRNPAAFCNVVGLRPSIGRVPNWPSKDAWESLATNGPMGRTVGDAALLLSVLSGGDARSPLAFPDALAPGIPELAGPLR
ncbi:amidase, partial [Leucobacter sp. OLES1]